MSILIKGDIGLPRDCCKCPFNCYGLCLANHSKLLVDKCVKSRHSDCPLVEVPTPHGRLIDADELKKNMRNYYPSIDHLCCSQHVVTKRDIDCAPTIIEAEEKSLICTR